MLELLREEDREWLDDDWVYPNYTLNEGRSTAGIWMGSGETSQRMFETALSVRRGPGGATAPLAWTSSLAGVVITNHRIAYSLLNLKRPNGELTMGGGGSGHMRFEWISEAALLAGGWRKPSRVALMASDRDGTPVCLLVQLPRGEDELLQRLCASIAHRQGVASGASADPARVHFENEVPVADRSAETDHEPPAPRIAPPELAGTPPGRGEPPKTLKEIMEAQRQRRADGER